MYRFFKERREAFKKYLLIFFLSIVSVGMVISLAPITPTSDMDLESNVLAEIHGASIRSADLQRLMQARLRNYPNATDPQMMSRLATLMLDDMVLRRALQDEAGKLGITVSNTELQRHIESTFTFLFPGGEFVGQDKYRDFVSQQMGMSVAQFEEQLREALLQEKMRAVITDGARVAPAEVHDEYMKRNAQARIEYILFDPARFLSVVNITPAALQEYFQKNAAKYTLPEQRRVRYCLITPDRVMAEIKLDDATLKKSYGEHLAEYQVPERVKVSHILFRTEGKTAAEIAPLEQKAREVLARIKAGSDFAAEARTNSEDSSAPNGGELGWIVRGQTVKEFEDTAFSLKAGQVSDVVKTTYGLHIIRVEEKQTPHLQTFEEVKDQIREQLTKQQLAEGQQSLASRLEREFQQAPADFAALARKSGLEPNETPLFRYNQPVADLGTSEGFQNLAFQLRENAVGSVSVPKGMAIIQVAEIVPAHAPELAAVRAVVEQDYRAEHSQVLAVEKAREFAEKAKAADFGNTAKSLGLRAETSKDFTQQDYLEGVGSGSSLSQAFTLPEGQTSEVVSIGNNHIVFRVLSRTAPDESLLSAQQDRLSEELLEGKRSLTWEIYQQSLKDRLKASGELKINETAMKKFLAGYQRS